MSKVVLGFSGGVDSAVSAKLLQQAGHQVVGLYLDNADRAAREEAIQIANIFHAKVIDVSRDSLTLWVFGSQSKSDALIDMLSDFGILEIAKTGTIAIERGRSTIYDDNKLKEEYDYGKNVL